MLVQSLARLLTNNCRYIGRRVPSQGYAIFPTHRVLRPLLWGGAVSAAVSLGFSIPTIYSDAGVKPAEKTEESEEKVGKYVHCLEGQASS